MMILCGMNQYLRRSYRALVEPLEKQSMHKLPGVSKDVGRATRGKKVWTSSWGSQFLILFKRTWTERRKDYFSALKFIQVKHLQCLSIRKKTSRLMQ